MTAPGFPAAVLWDFDGTLVDTEPLWLELEREELEALGGTWSPALADELVGTTMTATAGILLRHAGRPDPSAGEVEAVAGRLEHAMHGHLRGGAVRWRPGVERLLEELGAADVPSAIVSSSPASLLRAAVHALAPGVFSAVVAGDHGHRSKPHPAPYLAACELLGVRAADCVVVEDSPTGVAAGTAAGAWVIAVRGVIPVEHAPRRLVVDSLETIDLPLLRGLPRTGPVPQPGHHPPRRSEQI